MSGTGKEETIIDAEIIDDEPSRASSRQNPVVQTLDTLLDLAEAGEKPIRHVHAETADKIKGHVETFRQLRDDVEDVSDKAGKAKEQIKAAVKSGKEVLKDVGAFFEKVNAVRGSARMRRNPFGSRPAK